MSNIVRCSRRWASSSLPLSRSSFSATRTSSRIEAADRGDRVVKEFDAHSLALGFRWENIDHVAAYAIGSLCQVQLVARVLHLRQAPQELALVLPIATHEVENHR